MDTKSYWMLFFDFNEKSSLLLFFFIQGLVMSLLLLRKKWEGVHSAGWLSLLLLLFALYISPFMLGYSGWYGRDGYYEVLFYLPLQQVLLLGPIVYFYTKSLLDEGFKLTRKERIHFVPAILYLLYSFIIFIADFFILDEIYFYSDGQDKDFDLWYQILGFGSMLIYFLLSLQYYNRYKTKIFNELSYANEVVYRWVQHFLIALLMVLLLRILFFIINPEWGQFGRKFWYYLCFSMVFYYISIQGFAQYIQLANQPRFFRKEKEENEEIIKPEVQTSGLKEDPEKLHLWKKQLFDLVQNRKLYLNPRLTLSDMAKEMSLNTKQVSQVVNQGFDMNFNDFVNHHRTMALIEKLKAAEHQEKTLLALAYECGFNSKSTFNRAFKKETGKTPKIFLAEQVPNPDLKRQAQKKAGDL